VYPPAQQEGTHDSNTNRNIAKARQEGTHDSNTNRNTATAQQEGTHDSNTNRNTATCPNKVVTKTTRRTVALQQEQYP
jgi:hypothetical protein